MKKITTVLFDFDGTLMDTNDTIIESWQHTFKTIDGKERPLSEIVKTLGEPLELTMENFFPGTDISEHLSAYRDFQRENFEKNIKLFPGMKELVIHLKEKGYKLGIVTSRMKWSTIRGLEKYDIKEHFDAIVTADDTEKHKPDPEPANIALKKLGSTADESILIGDTALDVLCAKNVGMKSVLVGWSLAFPEEERTGEKTPDYVIKTADEVLRIFNL